MLGKTHITIGMAAALAITQPATAPELVCAVAGGGLGGWISDVDVRENPNAIDVAKSLPAIAVVLGASCALDKFGGLGVINSITAGWGPAAVVGVGLFVALTLIGMTRPHRTFTHSLPCCVLWGLSVTLVNADLGAAFSIGLASHIILDLFNMTGEQLFFPLKSTFCFGACPSDGQANQVLGGVGLIASLILACSFGVRVLADNESLAALMGSYGFSGLVAWLVIANVATAIVCCLYLLLGSASEGVQAFFIHVINVMALLGGTFAFILILLFASISGHEMDDDDDVIVRGDDGNTVSFLIAITATIAWMVVIVLAGNGFGLFQGMHVNPDPMFHMPLFTYLATINIATFVVFLTDAVIRHKFHAKELAMILLALAGGAAGGILAMEITNTKQGQTHFKVGLPFVLAFNTVIAALLVANGIV